MNRALVAVGVLALALAGWVLLAANDAGSDAGDMLGTLGVVVGAYAAGILLRRAVVPVAFVGLAVLAYALYASELPFNGGPLADPLHYGNANGALYVQVAALAGVAAASTRRVAIALVLGVACVVVACLPYVVGSAAGTGGAVLVVAATLIAFTPAADIVSRVGPVVALAVILLAGAGTILVAEHYGNGSPTDYCTTCKGGATGPEPRVVSVLSERRIELWRDAERLGRKYPLLGVGPGRFDSASPVARFDKDTRAAHSALLEQAAETGIVGAALLLGLAVAILLGISSAGSGAGLVAVAAWTAFCLHTEVDYVANFPWVVATAALVAGLATSWRRRTNRADGDEAVAG